MALFGLMAGNYTGLPYSNSYDDYAKGESEISVVGRLRQGATYMESLGATANSVRIMREGYTIPLLTCPPPANLRNNLSSRSKPAFVQHEIDKLLLSGAIKETTVPPYVVNPLTVASKNDKLRLVLDLRHINQYVKVDKCKLEGLESFLNTVRPGGYLISFDLKSGFHHVEINPTQHRLLGFSYHDTSNRVRFFYFVVLPFGLASATIVFTKLLRQLIKSWRQQEIQAFIFIDDGIADHPNPDTLQLQAKIIRRDLLTAGWIPHREKSSWTPCRNLSWLGFHIDLLHNLITAENKKISRAKALALTITNSQTLHVKILAKATGTLISLVHAFGDAVFLRTKATQILVDTAFTWCESLTVTPAVHDEWHFWYENLDSLNGMPIVTVAAAGHIVVSDASASACAASFNPYSSTNEIIVHRMFTKEEVGASSSYRELAAVLHGMNQAAHHFQGQTLLWYTDAKNLIRIVKRGSMVPELLKMALHLLYLFFDRPINLNALMCS